MRSTMLIAAVLTGIGQIGSLDDTRIEGRAGTVRQPNPLGERAAAPGDAFGDRWSPSDRNAPAKARVPTPAPLLPETKGSTVSGVRRALILCGHPGDEHHRDMYARTAKALHAGLTTQHGFASSDIRVLFGASPAAEEGRAVAGWVGTATREAIRTEVSRLCQRGKPEDAVWVIVLGHAHFDGRRAFFNIPGRDMSMDDFGRLFDDLQGREQVFFITTCLSGLAVKTLSRKGRIVIAATEADLEDNETLLHLALAEALATPPSSEEYDRDGDGRPTIYDLYLNVARGVMLRYKATGSIPTEHAQLDDNGDGRGTEVQIDYLEPELGGRTDFSEGRHVRPGHDGELAVRTTLNRNPFHGPEQPIPVPENVLDDEKGRPP
jgi:hypothetical protein